MCGPMTFVGGRGYLAQLYNNKKQVPTIHAFDVSFVPGQGFRLLFLYFGMVFTNALNFLSEEKLLLFKHYYLVTATTE